MTVLPITQYHSTELAGVLQPHSLCSAPGLNSSGREQWDIWAPEERLDLQVWPSSPTSNLRKGMQALQGASSQELPAGSYMQWGKRPLLNTYIFARYTHGSPLLHLAGLHHDTHHYWVTRVENELREYFQLAWKYCYMPGRWQEKALWEIYWNCRCNIISSAFPTLIGHSF